MAADDDLARLRGVEHIVVLMMENRSFDHMLGYLQQAGLPVNGLTGTETNPDDAGKPVKVFEYPPDFTAFHKPGEPLDESLDPCHDPADVAEQLKGGNKGFVKNFIAQKQPVPEQRRPADGALLGDAPARLRLPRPHVLRVRLVAQLDPGRHDAEPVLLDCGRGGPVGRPQARSLRPPGRVDGVVEAREHPDLRPEGVHAPSRPHPVAVVLARPGHAARRRRAVPAALPSEQGQLRLLRARRRSAWSSRPPRCCSSAAAFSTTPRTGSCGMCPGSTRTSSTCRSSTPPATTTIRRRTSTPGRGSCSTCSRRS